MKTEQYQEIEKLFKEYFSAVNNEQHVKGDGCIFSPGLYEILEIDFEKELVKYRYRQEFKEDGYYFDSTISFKKLRGEDHKINFDQN
ncbi:hypothetical protein NV226_02160 [Mycoplasma iguanae]|uniref:Uncharacterized protein n=1 Tax=Mycoplasma iguanae TaxID=292461 RepID=A0ABY5R7M9_9MOLU|nr:hypothetical protein [Mycoplasma iguanae]UVD81516.1 hypothetical protein NV226_02160 [Mycoplasma iguanae]